MRDLNNGVCHATSPLARIQLSHVTTYRIYSSITRILNFLIENWCMYPNKNVTSENTKLKQAMLKLSTTYMLQRRCCPLCCNILYYYII